MTTPTRIASFIFQSALCLGLAAGPVFAAQTEAPSQSDSRAMTRDQGMAEPASATKSAAQKKTATHHAAKTSAKKAHAKAPKTVASKHAKSTKTSGKPHTSKTQHVSMAASHGTASTNH